MYVARHPHQHGHTCVLSEEAPKLGPICGYYRIFGRWGPIPQWWGWVLKSLLAKKEVKRAVLLCAGSHTSQSLAGSRGLPWRSWRLLGPLRSEPCSSPGSPAGPQTAPSLHRGETAEPWALFLFQTFRVCDFLYSPHWFNPPKRLTSRSIFQSRLLLWAPDPHSNFQLFKSELSNSTL